MIAIDESHTCLSAMEEAYVRYRGQRAQMEEEEGEKRKEIAYVKADGSREAAKEEGRKGSLCRFYHDRDLSPSPYFHPYLYPYLCPSPSPFLVLASPVDERTAIVAAAERSCSAAVEEEG